MVDNVESTKNSYEKLQRKFKSDVEPEDGEPVYQGQKLKYYSKEIQFLKNHGVEVINSILSCYAEI